MLSCPVPRSIVILQISIQLESVASRCKATGVHLEPLWKQSRGGWSRAGCPGPKPFLFPEALGATRPKAAKMSLCWGGSSQI